MKDGSSLGASPRPGQKPFAASVRIWILKRPHPCNSVNAAHDYWCATPCPDSKNLAPRSVAAKLFGALRRAAASIDGRQLSRRFVAGSRLLRCGKGSVNETHLGCCG